jgi:ankyrin repeat protein
LEKDRATVSCPDGDGWTPLMYAAKSGCPEYVKLLLDFGADVNIQEVITNQEAECFKCIDDR